MPDLFFLNKSESSFCCIIILMVFVAIKNRITKLRLVLLSWIHRPAMSGGCLCCGTTTGGTGEWGYTKTSRNYLLLLLTG